MTVDQKFLEVRVCVNSIYEATVTVILDFRKYVSYRNQIRLITEKIYVGIKLSATNHRKLFATKLGTEIHL